MKKVLILLLIFSFSQSLAAQKQTAEIKAAIEGFFNGLSLLNADTLRHYTTPDFHLLEYGEIWNMDTLLNKIEPAKGKGIKRENSFEYARIEESDGKAWVSYYNTAFFSMGEKSQTVRWLESAVIVKQNGRWKVQMLHSTPLKH